MSVVRKPLERARQVKTARQAARLVQELEPELALNDDVDPEWEREADAALAELRRRFPGTDLSDPSEAQGPKGETYAPSYSRGAQKGAAGPSQNPASSRDGEKTSGDQKGARNSSTRGASAGRRTGGTGPVRAGRSRRASSPNRGGRGRRGAGQRAFEQTGIPGAARSATRTLLETLGLLVGLSLLYLVLTDAARARRGRAAVEQIANGVATAAAVLIRPVDVLGSAKDAAVDARAEQVLADGVPDHFAARPREGNAQGAIRRRHDARARRATPIPAQRTGPNP